MENQVIAGYGVEKILAYLCLDWTLSEARNSSCSCNHYKNCLKFLGVIIILYVGHHLRSGRTNHQHSNVIAILITPQFHVHLFPSDNCQLLKFGIFILRFKFVFKIWNRWINWNAWLLYNRFSYILSKGEYYKCVDHGLHWRLHCRNCNCRKYID